MIQERYNIEARVYIVGTISGERLIETETFRTVAESDLILDHEMVRKAICNTHLREAFVNEFARRLRSNLPLKRKIGGIRWSVEVESFTFSLVENSI